MSKTWKNVKNAVIRRVGRDRLEYVSNYGADAGFLGFTCYTDTSKFFKTYKKPIIERLKQDSEDCGISLLEMIKGFNAIKGDFSVEEIAKTLYGRRTYQEKNDLIQIDNVLAWYALETVAYEECNN